MTELSLTPADVFKTFPELQASGYSEDVCAEYIDEAKCLTEARFGKRTAFARKLFVAHWLTIMAAPAGGSSKSSNGQTGILASKAVGSASVSYDNSFGIDADAGWWNQTKYGQALWELMKRYRRMPMCVAGFARVPSADRRFGY